MASFIIFWATPSFEFTKGGIQGSVIFAMILTIIADHYLIFAMFFMQLRGLLCYWAVRKLGFSATELSKKPGVSQPAVSISVKRGEKIAKDEQIELVED